MKRIAVFLVLLLPHASHATSNTMGGGVVAKVTGAGTYADGSVYVLFDRQISSCSTENGRIDVAAGSPARDQVLSIAMTALVSGTSVKIHPNSCNGQRSVFDGTTGSYFYLIDE